MNYSSLSGSMLLLSTLLSTGLMAQMEKTESQISWKVAATIPPPRGAIEQFGLAGAWSGISHNVLIIAGGANFPEGMPWLGGKKKYYKEIYAFRKKNGSLIPIKKIFELPYTIAYGASCTTPQGVVCAGGENENGLSDKVILMQWNSAEQKIGIKNLPGLPVAVANASIAANENKVYLAGGETKEGVSSSLLHLDLNDLASGWTELSSLPKPVSHAVLIVQPAGAQPGLFIIGGRKRTSSGISELYNSVYAYDIENKKWAAKRSLPYALSAGTGISFSSTKILLFGGDKGAAFHKTEELIASVNSEADPAKKEALNSKKMDLQSAHPGFSNELLQYNTITNEWNVRGAIPFDVPVTTNVVKCGNEVFITSGEIRAGVRTPLVWRGTLKKDK